MFCKYEITPQMIFAKSNFSAKNAFIYNNKNFHNVNEEKYRLLI